MPSFTPDRPNTTERGNRILAALASGPLDLQGLARALGDDLTDIANALVMLTRERRVETLGSGPRGYIYQVVRRMNG